MRASSYRCKPQLNYWERYNMSGCLEFSWADVIAEQQLNVDMWYRLDEFSHIEMNEDVNEHRRSDRLFEKMKNRWCPHLLCSHLNLFFFVLCSPLSPSNNRSWKVHWFKKDGPFKLTQQTNKQTNSLTGGSCEAAVGSAGVVFDDNAWSLCSLCHWAACFHFSSAQLSANIGYSLKCPCTRVMHTRTDNHTIPEVEGCMHACT